MRVQGVVVGATGAIGRACATALADSVDDLILTGRDMVRLAEVAEACGVRSRPVLADLSHADGCRAVVEAIEAINAPIRWVVVAAGAPLRGPLSELSASDISQTYETNLIGPTLLLKALGEQSWTGGASLVVIGSVSSARALAKRTVYAASKAGIERMALSLASEWAGRGIQINVVSPGVIRTPFLGPDSSQVEDWVAERVPAGRCGRPDEVAQVVRFVALGAPEYLVGARIVVDGGLEAVL